MPQEPIFHKAHALALDRMRDETTWATRTIRDLGKRFLNLRQVMPIDFAYGPPEGTPLGVEQAVVSPAAI
jgi:hypothetical protein